MSELRAKQLEELLALVSLFKEEVMMLHDGKPPSTPPHTPYGIAMWKVFNKEEDIRGRPEKKRYIKELE